MRLEILLAADGPSVVMLDGVDISNHVKRDRITIEPGVRGYSPAVVTLPLAIRELSIVAEQAKPLVTVEVDLNTDSAAMAEQIKRTLGLWGGEGRH